VLLAATLGVALSDNKNTWLMSNAATVVASFVLSSTLGFVLTNHLLELPNPLLLTVAIILAGAVFVELTQLFIAKHKAALRDIVFVMIGSGLFLIMRYAMHETGSRIIDQFEAFLD
jgi:VanZ family protein